MKQYKMQPFVKWAGGKRQILYKLKERMPKEYNAYHEPFVGGGALFLDIAPKKAYINDYNKELITTYKTISSKDKLEKLIYELELHEDNHSEGYYSLVRGLDRTPSFNNLDDYIIAARFIYLNKAGFNGLYRVNKQGYFNVPSGKRKVVNTFSKSNLVEIHNYLTDNNVTILNLDFEEALKYVEADDFVYLDPPYDTYEDKGFTAYTNKGFNKTDQARLALQFKRLDKIGAKLMLSNHNTELIRELYKDFNIKIIKANRAINSKVSGRGPVEEVIITNY